MAALQQLTKEQATILQALDGRVMLGAELMKRVGMGPAQLMQLIYSLMSMDLVQVSGDLSPDRVAFAAFSSRPSDRDLIRKNIAETLAKGA